jgi:hypothetical protein
MKLLKQNSKMKLDGIWSFGMTPIKTCPMAGECKKFCYATKGLYKRFAKTIEPSLARAFEATKGMDFVDVIDLELSKKRKQPKLIRIHTEGDFYNQAYLEKWETIARAYPTIQFYAYTKSLHLDFSQLPDNFKIIQSEGGKLDSKIDYTKPHARIFKNREELLQAGYEDASESDLVAANKDNIKIGLIAH